jgi:hypothetical protein
MPKLDKPAMLALISVALFYVFGTRFAYENSVKVFGSIVGQSEPAYGTGNGYTNYGFLLHAVLFGLVAWFIFKKQLR